MVKLPLPAHAPLALLLPCALMGTIACRTTTATTAGPQTTVQTPPGASGELPSPAVLAQTVARLSRDVEEIRGYRFTAPVPIEVKSAEEISSYFRGELEDASPEQQIDEWYMVALGYIENESSRDVDALARMMSSEAQGVYDTERRVLVLPQSEARVLMRPGPAGLDARTTVVHELVHALQQQHFAERVNVDPHGAALAEFAGVRLSLLEGDATLVGLEWTARQRSSRLLGTPELRPRVLRWAERAQLLTEVNIAPYILDAMEQPYETGTLAVTGLYEHGQWAAIDHAHRTLSLNSGQLLHPERAPSERYASVTDFAPLTVTAIDQVAVRALGELELRLFLESVLRKERAWTLAASWRGDAAALFRTHEGALAVRWRIQCDSPENAQEIVSASQGLLTRWERVGCPQLRGGTEHHCEASITRDGSVITVSRGRIQ